MTGVERFAGASIKKFRVWLTNDSAGMIKVSVDKDKDAAFRQTAPIFQANMNRCKKAQNTLRNNEALANFLFILGQEPGCFPVEGEVVLHGTDPRWMKFVPSERRDGPHPVLSCIWVCIEMAVTQLEVYSQT
jgi:hypothetical protein